MVASNAAQDVLLPITPTQTLESRVYSELRQAIVEGRLPAGEHLVLSRLARMLNVSRVPVTQALKRLETQGYVRSNGKGDVLVYEPDAEDVWEIGAIYERLISLAARVAAQRATLDDIALIEGLAYETSRREGKERVLADRRFHAAVVATSRMPWLINIVDMLRDFQEMQHNALEVLTPDPALAASSYDISNREHFELVDAIKKGDSEKADEVARIQAARSTKEKLDSLRRHRGSE